MNELETIELINGVGGTERIKIPADGRNEYHVPFVCIYDSLPMFHYVYRRVGNSHVFDYKGIEKIDRGTMARETG
jgi:hypothetical protein